MPWCQWALAFCSGLATQDVTALSQLCFPAGVFVLFVLSDPMDEKGQQGLKQCLSDLIQASKVTTAVLRADPQVGNTLSAILKIAGSISTRLSRNWIKICSILLQSNQIIGSKHTPAMAQALPMPGLYSFIPAVWPFFLAWEVLLCSCHSLPSSSTVHPANQVATLPHKKQEKVPHWAPQ